MFLFYYSVVNKQYQNSPLLFLAQMSVNTYDRTVIQDHGYVHSQFPGVLQVLFADTFEA